MLVSDLKVALRRYGFDTDDPLLVWINAGYHLLELEYSWPFLEAELNSIPLSTGINTIVAPSDFGRMIKLRDVTDESTQGTGTDLRWTERREWERDIDSAQSSGIPEAFSLLGDATIRIWPVPDSDRLLNMLYQKSLPDLADDDETPLMPNAFHYGIVQAAAFIALQAESEEDRAKTAQAQYEATVSKLMMRYNPRQVGEVQGVADVMDYTV